METRQKNVEKRCPKLVDNEIPEVVLQKSEGPEDTQHAQKENMRPKFVILTGFLIIIWQLTMQNSIYKPSYFLHIIATTFVDFFVKFGSQLTVIATKVADFINFKSLAIAVYELGCPLFQIIISPYYILKGVVVGLTVPQEIAVVTLFLLTIIFLIIMETQCKGNYKPTIWLVCIHKWIKKFYDGVYVIGMEFLQFPRMLGLDKSIENFIKIIYPIMNIIVTPVGSLIYSAKNIVYTKYGTATAMGFLTITCLYFYGNFLTFPDLFKSFK